MEVQYVAVRLSDMKPNYELTKKKHSKYVQKETLVLWLVK